MELSLLYSLERVKKVSRIVEVQLSVLRGFCRTRPKSGAYLLDISEFVVYHVWVREVIYDYMVFNFIIKYHLISYIPHSIYLYSGFVIIWCTY